MLDLDVYDYIEELQKVVYRVSLGQVRPRECLYMTLPEIAIVINEGTEILHERLIFHADLKTAVLNGPHFYKKNQKPYTLEEFLPKSIAKSLKPEVRPEDQARLIQERGDALAAKCRQYKTRK